MIQTEYEDYTNKLREHTIDANNNIERQAREQLDIEHWEHWTAGPIAVLDCPNCGLTDRWHGSHSQEHNPDGTVSCSDCDFSTTYNQATIFEIPNRS